MFSERPIPWSHLIDAEDYFTGLRITLPEPTWDAPDPDETSAVLTFRPNGQRRGRLIRNWLHDQYIGECRVTGCYWNESEIPVAARFRFPTFDDKLLFSLRWL